MNFEILKNELSKEKYKLLKDSQNYEEIAKLLNESKLIDNPTQQSFVPKRFTLSSIFAEIAKVSPSDVLKLGDIAGWVIDGTKTALESNNRNEMANYLAICSGKLSAESKAKLQSLLLETEVDPNWQSKISTRSISQELGLGFVSKVDVQTVINLC